PALAQIHVDADAAPGGDGASWATAFPDLQDGLAAAAALSQAGPVEVWVAEGVYRPGPAGNRAATFILRNNVALYGGFAGGETSREERDPSVNLTILSGDLAGDDEGTITNRGDNAYHVVTASVVAVG